MLKTVGDNQSDDLEDDGNSELGDDVDFRSVTKYPSIADVIVEWTKKEPLSVVIANKGGKHGVPCCFSYGKYLLLWSSFGMKRLTSSTTMECFTFPLSVPPRKQPKLGSL